jgi:hypothetical protein
VLEFCKENPESEDSGLYYISNGKPASCSEVLKQNSVDLEAN